MRNEIDRFVLARLDAEKLTHSTAADRRMLIRRLSLDLTGLPPSTKEVEAFVNDVEPKAIERLVGADSLGYLSIDGLLRAVDMPRESFCLACFTGNYPVPVQLEFDKLELERDVRVPAAAEA